MCQAVTCFHGSSSSFGTFDSAAAAAAAPPHGGGLLQHSPSNGVLSLLGPPMQGSWITSRPDHVASAGRYGSRSSLTCRTSSFFHSSGFAGDSSSSNSSSSGAGSSGKAAAHAGGGPAQEQQEHARSSHAQQKGHNAHAAGHHGSAAAAHGMSSYELAAEKMTDREILGTLAQHLWPKGTAR